MARWGFPAKPALTAGGSDARQPGFHPRNCSTPWRTPAALFRLRRGCGQRWVSLVADGATSGVLFPPFVASTESLESELNSFFTAPWGPNHVPNLDAFASQTPIKHPFPLKPAFKRGSCATALLPCIRHFVNFSQEFQALRDASFFASVTTSLRFPLTDQKPCHSIA
jgi:hypothetical protein